jgi:hypothetical protein
VILGENRDAFPRRMALDIAEPSPFRGGTAGAAVECGGCTRWIRYSRVWKGSQKMRWGVPVWYLLGRRGEGCGGGETAANLV